MTGYAALDPCVHCGFCLPACPTYLVTGEEGHSPRGRIVLMRALERGEMSPHDPGLLEHLEACLGCRGCEPVCPSGVGYGRGLEAAREQIFHARGLSPLTRLVLRVFRHREIWRPLFALARAFRATGLPQVLSGKGRLGFGMGMLASSTEVRSAEHLLRGAAKQQPQAQRSDLPDLAVAPVTRPAIPQTVILFRGCVMNALFSHVHDATKRTLQVN